MQEQFSRTQLIIGTPAMDKLEQSRVAVFGIGGVGGYAAEALARSGIGSIDIIDHDKVCLSNINRQIIATTKTVGQYKVDVMEQRIKDINPNCKVKSHKCFYLPATKDEFDFAEYDYIVDAVDTVTAKLQLITEAKLKGTPIISSMGAGNKMDPCAFKVADIYETSICPLARILRKECRKRGIDSLKVVYSEEKPLPPLKVPATPASSASTSSPADTLESDLNANPEAPTLSEQPDPGRRSIPGSSPFVPSVVGLIIASEVVKDLIQGLPREITPSNPNVFQEK